MPSKLTMLFRSLFTATPTQWASHKPSDREICDAIIATMNNPLNNYDPY